MSAGELRGSRALITGAGNGTGRAIAYEFAAAGAHVALVDIDSHAVGLVAEHIQSEGGSAIALTADVSRSSSISDAVFRVTESFGGLDIAVNNAALPPDQTMMADLDESEWNRIISVNLTGVAWCLKHEVKSMRLSGTGGSIINISSIRGTRARKGSAAYVAAKHGVNGLTRVAALEAGKYGIRVNAVAPGPVHTDMLTEALGGDEGALADIASKTSLLGRIAEPEDIALTCVWLASQKSKHVTGAIVPVDGGYGASY